MFFFSESKGCQTIVPLEHLQHHLTNCVFNHSEEASCDIRISEYEATNCLTDLANRQREEITKLNAKIDRQREEIKELTIAGSNQRKEINKLSDEVVRSANIIQRQQEEITKLSDQQISDKSAVVVNAKPKWRISTKMNTSIGQPQFLEHVGRGFALAQLFFCLKPSTNSFQIKVLNVAANNKIAIGLTPKEHPVYIEPGLTDTSAGYSSYKYVNVNNKRKSVGQAWEIDDVIECSIKCSYNFKDDGEVNISLSMNE